MKEENEKLKLRNEDYHNKLVLLQQKDKVSERTTQDLKSLSEAYAKYIDEKDLQLLKTEENLIRKYETTEKNMKINMKKMYDDLKNEYVKELKSHTKQIESLKIENNELKFQNRNYKNKIDDFIAVIKQKEDEVNEILSRKDKEIAKHLKVLGVFEKELEDLSSKYQAIKNKSQLNIENKIPEKLNELNNQNLGNKNVTYN